MRFLIGAVILFSFSSADYSHAQGGFVGEITGIAIEVGKFTPLELEAMIARQKGLAKKLDQIFIHDLNFNGVNGVENSDHLSA